MSLRANLKTLPYVQLNAWCLSCVFKLTRYQVSFFAVCSMTGGPVFIVHLFVYLSRSGFFWTLFFISFRPATLCQAIEPIKQ